MLLLLLLLPQTVSKLLIVAKYGGGVRTVQATPTYGNLFIYSQPCLMSPTVEVNYRYIRSFPSHQIWKNRSGEVTLQLNRCTFSDFNS